MNARASLAVVAGLALLSVLAPRGVARADEPTTVPLIPVPARPGPYVPPGHEPEPEELPPPPPRPAFRLRAGAGIGVLTASSAVPVFRVTEDFEWHLADVPIFLGVSGTQGWGELSLWSVGGRLGLYSIITTTPDFELLGTIALRMGVSSSVGYAFDVSGDGELRLRSGALEPFLRLGFLGLTGGANVLDAVGGLGIAF